MRDLSAIRVVWHELDLRLRLNMNVGKTEKSVCLKSRSSLKHSADVYFLVEGEKTRGSLELSKAEVAQAHSLEVQPPPETKNRHGVA
jgi:hypothetical protein